MKRYLLAALIAVSFAFASPVAFAQQVGSPAPVQQNQSRLDASTGVCALGPAVNATQAAGTCTITPPAGQYVYFNYMQVAACQDGTASISGIQLNFTSTNLGGWVVETSTLSAATIATNPFANLCAYSGGALTAPLKSAAAGTAVTVVPPAQTAHMSFAMNLQYYFAP
jgi:hypothetical protein